jgi:hypothetical protein
MVKIEGEDPGGEMADERFIEEKRKEELSRAQVDG